MKAIGVRAEQKGQTHGRYRPALRDKQRSPLPTGCRSLIAATNASGKMAIRHTALSCFFAVISLVRPRCRLSLAPTAGSRRRRAQVGSRLAASSAATEGLALMRPSTTARWLDRGLPFLLLFLGSHSVGSAAPSGSRFSPQSAARRCNIWFEAQALQGPQRARTLVRLNGHRRSHLHLRPGGQPMDRRVMRALSSCRGLSACRAEGLA